MKLKLNKNHYIYSQRDEDNKYIFNTIDTYIGLRIQEKFHLINGDWTQYEPANTHYLEELHKQDSFEFNKVGEYVSFMNKS